MENCFFVCPKCGENLIINNHSCVCENKHCYDIAKEGYLNLHLTNKKSELIGDNKEMIKARRDFLDLGHYEILANEICKILSNYVNKNSLVLDCGCGSGYYTNIIKRKVNCNVIGVDISKEGVKIASKLNKDVQFAVASAYDLPLKDQSVDVIVSVFAPYAFDEMHRVLKPNGKIIFVSPNKLHLWELKTAIYGENVYEKDFSVNFDNFVKVDIKTLTYEFVLKDELEVSNLITMTPYCYKTPKALLQKANNIIGKNIKADFLINILENY